jgi:hypothetical protein
MASHDTITVTLELDVPVTLVQSLLTRHILRVLRGSRNGHAPGSPTTLPSPGPIPIPQEEHAAPAGETLARAPASGDPVQQVPSAGAP